MIAWLRSARGLAALLVVSLALNLFLGGMLVGRITGQAVRGVADAAQHPGDARAVAGREARARAQGDRRRDASACANGSPPCKAPAPRSPRKW